MGEVPRSSRLDKLAQAQWINYDDDDNRIDIAFSNIVQMSTNFKREYVKSQYVRKKRPHKNESIQVSLEYGGNDATGLKWMFVLQFCRRHVSTDGCNMGNERSASSIYSLHSSVE